MSIFYFCRYSMVKFKFFICFLFSVMLFTSANAQVFLDDKEPVQEELKTIDTIVTLEEDGTNINDMLNINTYIYDTIDQVEKKYIQQMYVSAPKPTDDIKVNLGVKKNICRWQLGRFFEIN